MVARPQTQLTGSPWAYSSGGATKTFILASNTSILGILLPGFATVSELKVTGVTSSVVYLDINPETQAFQQFYYTPVMDAVDTQVTVSISASSGATAYVASIPDPVGVLSLPANPPPWQAPNQFARKFSFTNPGAGNTRTIVPNGFGGRTLYLHTAVWVYSAVVVGSTGTFQDSAGTDILADDATLSGVPRFMDFKGTPITAGAELDYHQSGAAAVGTYTISGSFTYAVF